MSKIGNGSVTDIRGPEQSPDIRRLIGRMILGIGYLLAATTVIGWFWFVVPEVFSFAKHVHYPIKLLGVAVCLGVLSGYGVLRPARCLADRIDPAARVETEAEK